MNRYTIVDHGAQVACETWVADGRNHARLLVDGREAAVADTEAVGRVDLRDGEAHHVQVAWWWRGRVARCVLVEKGSDQDLAGRRPLVTPLVPPPGSRAARAHAYRSRHPRLYAARHVAVQVASVLGALLGISALLRSLLPRIDWSWLPSIPWSIEPPEWLRYLDLLGWLRALLPDWDLPDPGWLSYGKYVVPVVVAVAVAVQEVRRRRAREEREAELARRGSRPDPAPRPPAADPRRPDADPPGPPSSGVT